MRAMAREIELGRERALEAERAETFRESARRVAHELKNPLTPIRFAIDRLARDVSPDLRDTVAVLDVESRRLERMARSFAQFGRLPEGPAADVDMAELTSYAVRSTIPPHIVHAVDIEDGLPMVHGHYETLARALTNVLINAVEACGDSGTVEVRVRRHHVPNAADQVEITVKDSGCGIAPERLASIWEPYITDKAGGTGLGLAIVRQTIQAHGGAVAAASAPGRGTEIRFTLPVGHTDVLRGMDQ